MSEAIISAEGAEAPALRSEEVQSILPNLKRHRQCKNRNDGLRQLVDLSAIALTERDELEETSRRLITRE